MQDGTQKHIDLDELVNTLLQERQAGSPVEKPAPAAETSAPQPLPATPPMMDPKPEQPVPPPVEVAASPEKVPETEVVEEPEAAPAVPKKKEKRRLLRELFAQRNEPADADAEDWSDWGLKPIGHYRVEEEPPAPDDIESIVEEPQPEEPPAVEPVDEFPPVQAVAETITLPVILPPGTVPAREDATRVIPVIGNRTKPETASPAPVQEPVSVDDQLPDQLSLEEMVRVEDIDPEAPMPEEKVDPEELVQRAREERIREFAFGGEEEVNEPEEEVEEVEEEPEIEDFTGYQDTKAIQLELQYRCRTGLFSLLATAVLEVILLAITLFTALVGEAPMTGVGYLTVHLFAMGLMIALNYNAVSRGLTGLFSLHCNRDTAPAAAAIVSLLAVILHFINASEALPFWTPIAGLLLVMTAGARYSQAVCVQRNFAFVAYPGPKYAAALIEEENALREIGRRTVGDGQASVAYFRPTGFLSDYLTNAYEEDRSDDWSRWLTPIGLGISLLLSIILAVSGQAEGFWNWLRLFVGLVTLSMQATGLAVQLPLSQCSRHMLSRGGFLTGWKAVRQFGNPDALVVDVADLYPDESMLLHGIKTFSGAHIDDAILDAASLSVRSGGPLSMIFRRIIQNKEELLHEVDSLVYEQGMGLSGWVDGRRVLVGNRRLLQNHGVDVPSLDYEARYAKDGRKLVYLSTAGELSAMFVVSYLADPEIQSALQDLCRSKVTLLVRSCDPNLTAADLCENFDLDEYYVDVLPAAAGRLYMQLVQGESESVPSVMASNGHILGTARALAACRSLQVKSVLALSVQMLASALGVLLCIVWFLEGTLSLFQPLMLVLASLVLTWLLPLFRRI